MLISYSTGVNLLFASGEVSVFRISNEIYHMLIPAMVEALTVVQTRYPYPPDPEVYEGVYSITGLPLVFQLPGQFNVSIITIENQLVMVGPISVYLAYGGPLHLQVCIVYLMLQCVKCMGNFLCLV